MKFRILGLLLALGLFFVSCDNVDCSAVSCVSNSTFRFELVNNNQENILSNGSLQIDDIKITDLDSQNTVEFDIINQDNNDIIVINSFNLPTSNYNIQASGTDVFDLLIIVERNVGDCCDVIRFSELEILNSEFSFDENRFIYTFLFE